MKFREEVSRGELAGILVLPGREANKHFVFGNISWKYV
jgi:hypothetical protein